MMCVSRNLQRRGSSADGRMRRWGNQTTFGCHSTRRRDLRPRSARRIPRRCSMRCSRSFRSTRQWSRLVPVLVRQLGTCSPVVQRFTPSRSARRWQRSSGRTSHRIDSGCPSAISSRCRSRRRQSTLCSRQRRPLDLATCAGRSTRIGLATRWPGGDRRSHPG